MHLRHSQSFMAYTELSCSEQNIYSMSTVWFMNSSVGVLYVSKLSSYWVITCAYDLQVNTLESWHSSSLPIYDMTIKLGVKHVEHKAA